MTIAVAVWDSPTAYTLAADSRVSTAGGAGQNLTVRKVFQVGRWFFAAAGDGPACIRYRKHLAAFTENGKPFDVVTREDVEELLEATHELVRECGGPTEPGEYNAVGAEVLIVGPAGVGTMSPTGDVYWRDDATFAAVGCAFEYAAGWLDRGPVVNRADAEAVIRVCCEKFAGCGLPIHVLHSEDIVEPVARPKRARTKTGPAAQTAGDAAPVPRPKRAGARVTA